MDCGFTPPVCAGGRIVGACTGGLIVGAFWTLPAGGATFAHGALCLIAGPLAACGRTLGVTIGADLTAGAWGRGCAIVGACIRPAGAFAAGALMRGCAAGAGARIAGAWVRGPPLIDGPAGALIVGPMPPPLLPPPPRDCALTLSAAPITASMAAARHTAP